MKKKMIISSLLIGSLVSTLPLNFLFNNKDNSEQNIENENTNESEEISNTTNLDTRDQYVDPLYSKNYSTLYFNNFTNPVISPNDEIPGYLGAWDINSIGSFPNAIGWTTPNLFLSWSANLIDHPSLEGQVPAGFSPGLVTALHSDEKDSSNKRNQIFAIVANTSNLSAREYWILRYNALDGSPIKDANSKMPKMNNSPIPEMSATNANGSAFSLTNDTINDRYIAFYPGEIQYVVNEMFGFKIDNENKIQWLENKTHFNGHNDYIDVDIAKRFDYAPINIVLGLSPLKNKKASGGASLALMVAVHPVRSTDDKYNLKILNLQDNLAHIPSFSASTIIGDKSGIFNNTNSTIEISKHILTSSSAQKNINPKLQIIPFQNSLGDLTYKAQMILPILNGNEWVYMYLSSIHDDNRNTYLTQYNNRALSQGSFFSSASFNSNAVAPTIHYNDELPQEILITSQGSRTNKARFDGNQFNFPMIPLSTSWDPSLTIINSLNYSLSNDVWRSKQIFIRNPYVDDTFMWSVPNGLTEKYARIGDQTILLSRINGGGIKHLSFQQTASSLKWLLNQENAKVPSKITPAELETIGTNDTDFFKIPNITYPDGISALAPEIKLFGEPLKDDKKGILQGIFTLKQKFIIQSNSYDFESKIPFRITGLNIGNVPTSINQNNQITNFLPSDLTPNNIPNLIDIIALPDDSETGGLPVIVDNWLINDQDNANGTATVSVDIQPHFNDEGELSNSKKTITANLSGLKKVSGTTAVQNPQANLDVTVWDIDPTNASNFVEVKDLIPGSPNDAVTFETKDHKPLNGELTILVSIKGGSYYNPDNKGLPSNNTDKPLQIPITISGLKTISNTGTLVNIRKGPHVGFFPSFIDENNISDFFTIENEVPGSKFTITDIVRSDELSTTEGSFDGFVSFKIDFDKAYDTRGFIIDPQPQEYKIEGFQGGVTPKSTTILSTGNKELFSNTLALEINETNINQFIIIFNLPDGVVPKYEFVNQKNTGQKDTGFQDVRITLSNYLDDFGDPSDDELVTTTRINDLKTVPAATSVTTLSGERDILPELISPVGLEKYLRINNPSPILGRETSIELITDKLVSNNINGSISFEYKLINAVTDFGFIEESNPIPVTVSGFQRGNFTTIEQIIDIKDKKASEFDLNKDNFFDFAKLVGYSIPLEIDEQGNVSGTTIEKVEKISSNDATGVATFKVSVQGGAINQEGKFIIDLLDITFTFDGFEIVAVQDNTIPIIAGAVAGGVVLIIIIVVAIVLVNNNKNKKILNEKRKPSAPSAPPANSGVARSVAPSQGRTPSMGPQTPGATRPVQPSAGPVKPTAPQKK
ncbi:MAG: hypothetical protein ACRCUM_01155 [Mycoplasmoidaceae bacterium]